MKHLRASADPDSVVLTPRELKLVKLVVEGKLNKEIAWEFRLTVGTVKEYVYKLCRKVECRNRAELIGWAKCELFCPKEPPR